MAKHINVMISSTVRDLPEHRKEVMDACLRQGMFPVMMEHLPACDDEAIGASLKMVDNAEIYLGIYAHRYGFISAGHDISITEMEYNRAVERGIPRLIFIMDEAHPINSDRIETGDRAIKLKTFKERLLAQNIVIFFNSPADLRAHAINSLSHYRHRDLTTFHYLSDIPSPPERYIAHPYTLLQTQSLIGRQAELTLLTDWAVNTKSKIYQARIFNVVAIGGMGKSALTWKWFNDIAPQVMKPLAGRMWWSFYESDAHFENFVTRALAYVSRQHPKVIQEIPVTEREEKLLTILDREPFLLVLDGLERLLIAYARMDASRLADDDLDQQTANVVTDSISLSDSAMQPFTGQHRLRKTADPRAGAFLRKLAQIRAARILVSTRLFPADLQTNTGLEIAASKAYFLTGLRGIDSLNLWKALGVSGSGHELLPLFESFDNHPLLIQALAGEIAHYRTAPGDFDCWRKDHPEFNPFALPLAQRKSHALYFAMRGLEKAPCEILLTIAAFRMPVAYDTLAAMLIGQERLYTSENMLDADLSALEDRGLLGWDKRANRYDLHPIVRGVCWSLITEPDKQKIYQVLHGHFKSLPPIYQYQVQKEEQLIPAIELCNTLLGLKRYDDAYRVFRDRLGDTTLSDHIASHRAIELLELFFPRGLDQLPELGNYQDCIEILNFLGMAYRVNGQPQRSTGMHRLQIKLGVKKNDLTALSFSLHALSQALFFSGKLYDAEAAIREELSVARKRNDPLGELGGLQFLLLILAARGMNQDFVIVQKRALEICKPGRAMLINSYIAQQALWTGDFVTARTLADRVWEEAHDLAHYEQNKHEFVRAARLQGEAALGEGEFDKAAEYLHYALNGAREVSLLEEELPILVALAELYRRQRNIEAACELLDDVWEPAERGPYPLFHADAYNVLAQIEHDTGNEETAGDAANKAYRLAWCDGPPFAYHWGIKMACKHLAELSIPEPSDLISFDASRYKPVPEIEIVPPNELEAEKK